MQRYLFLANVSGYFVKEEAKYVGDSGIQGVKREVYAKLFRSPANLEETFTSIRVDNLFRGWFNWKLLNAERIQMIIESIQFVSRDLLFGITLDFYGNAKSKEFEEALLKQATMVVINHQRVPKKHEHAAAHHG